MVVVAVEYIWPLLEHHSSLFLFPLSFEHKLPQRSKCGVLAVGSGLDPRSFKSVSVKLEESGKNDCEYTYIHICNNITSTYGLPFLYLFLYNFL